MDDFFHGQLACFVAAGVAWSTPEALAQAKNLNMLVIMSDDVGLADISASSMGLVGYETPNIDRRANRGTWFSWSSSARLDPPA